MNEEAYRDLVREEAFNGHLQPSERALLESDPSRWVSALRAMITEVEMQLEQRRIEIDALRHDALRTQSWGTYHERLAAYEEWRKRAAYVKRKLAARSPVVKNLAIQQHRANAAKVPDRTKSLRHTMRHIIYWLGKFVEEDEAGEVSDETWEKLIDAWHQFRAWEEDE